MYFVLINIHVLCSYYIKTLFASYAVILNDTSDAASVKVNSEFVFLWLLPPAVRCQRRTLIVSSARVEGLPAMEPV